MLVRHNIILFSAVLGVLFLMVTSVNAYEFPPYKGIALKVIGNITGNYSNNVTFASDNENRIEDYRTMLNLGLNFQHTGKRHNFGFSGSAQRQIFEGSFNDLNPSENVTMTFSNEFTKYDRITLRNTFRHSLEPSRVTGDFDIAGCMNYFDGSSLISSEIEAICNEFKEEFGRLRGRFDSYSNNASFDYYKGISDTVSLRTNYIYAKNWSSAEGTNDSDRNTLGLSLNYSYSHTTSFSLSYSYQLSKYDEGEDISIDTFNAGVRQYITKSILFNGSIGQTAVSSGRDSISFNSGLSAELNEKTSAGLSYSQGIQTTANTNDTFDNWRLSGTLSRIMQEELKGSLSAFYGKGEYSATDVTDSLMGASANLSYAFWQGKRGSSMGANIGYSYSDLVSTNAAREYTRNSIKLGLLLAF